METGQYYDPTSSEEYFVPGGETNSLNIGNGIISSVFYDPDNLLVQMYPFAEGQGSHLSAGYACLFRQLW